MNGSLDRPRAAPRPTVRPIASALAIIRWAVLLAILASVLTAAFVHAAPAGARGAIDPSRSATPTAIFLPYPPMVIRARPVATAKLVPPPLPLGPIPLRPWPTCVPFRPDRDVSYPQGADRPSVICPYRANE